ncbi:MAG: tetraacyldisaccharide 4'-kinase [Candidatus Lernaella stagnicola]|nr:tetraacyldisaccharide 4'-kinase [Candidatus Lernaella stagnicola]
MAPVGWLYGTFMRVREAAYANGWLRSTHPDSRVISIGNLTMGGTGKTPVTVFLAASLTQAGHRVAVVSRGYHGSLEGRTAVVSDGSSVRLTAREAGDEPIMLARRLPGVPVLIGANRGEAAERAVAEFQPDIILCDDAFSHLRLRRDLNLVLVHGRDGLGNRRVTPAGPLREPPSALRRADAVIINTTTADDPAVTDQLLRAGFRGPIFRVRYGAPGFRRHPGGETVAGETLANQPVLAFAATARPADFFVSLRRADLQVVETKAFPDHHAYCEADLQSLTELAAQRGIGYLVTTEKDAVKLPARASATGQILVAGIELIGEGDDLSALLALVTASDR